MTHEAFKKLINLDVILKNNRVKAAEAIDKMGGPAAAGRTLTERTKNRGSSRKITIGIVWSWLNRDKCGIPLQYIIDVEEESGISRMELRGDVPWNKC